MAEKAAGAEKYNKVEQYMLGNRELTAKEAQNILLEAKMQKRKSNIYLGITAVLGIASAVLIYKKL